MIVLIRTPKFIAWFILLAAFVAMLRTPVATGFCQIARSDDAPELIFSKEAKLGAVYRKNHLNFYRKLVQLYGENTKDPISLQQPAIQYLISSISNATGQVHREDNAWQPQSELFAIGKKLLDDGCEDPLVMLFHSKIINGMNSGNGRNVGFTKGNKPVWFEPNENPTLVAQRGLKAFEESAYPKGLKILFLGALNRAAERQHKRQQANLIIKDDLSVLDAIPDWIDYVKGTPDWERIAYAVIQRHPMKGHTYRDLGYSKNNNGQKQLARIKKLATKGKLSDWLHQMMLADHYNTFPRSHRVASSRFSVAYQKQILASDSEESKQARRLAAEHYRAAYELNKSFPESAAHLIMLAYEGFESKNRFTWFQRAIDSEVDNPSAYYYLLLTSDKMNSEAVVNLANQFFESGRFDTAIPRYFLNCVCKLPWYRFRSLMARDDAIFMTTRDLFVKYAEEDGGDIENSMLSQRQINNLRDLVNIAADAGRFDVAVKYSQLLDQVSPNWFAETKDRIYLRSMIHARNNYPDELEGANFSLDDLMATGRPTLETRELADLYAALAADSDPISTPYLKMCSILADYYWRYENGETVKLGSEFPADHLWGIRGNFSCHDDGTMDVTNNPKTRLIDDNFTLSYRGSFALPREIQCDMNLLNWTGQPECGVQGYRSVAVFNLWPHFGRASIECKQGDEYIERKIVIPGLKAREPAHLVVRVWDKANFQFFVNGVFVESGDIELEKVDDGIGFLGRTSVFGNNPRTPEVSVQISNVQVRKLNFGPPPKRNQPKQGLEYFSAAITQEPEIAYNYLRRADCHAQLGNVEEALSDYQRALKDDTRINSGKLRFVRFCLLSGKYEEAHSILHKLLGELRAAKKVVDAARLGKVNGKKKSWKAKQKDQLLLRQTLAKYGFLPAQKLGANIENLEAQLLFLQGTCPDANVRSTEISEKLLESAQRKSKTLPAVRFLGRAYVEAELKQYDQAVESLAAAKKAAGDSEELVALIESAREAVEKRQPIRHAGEQICVLDAAIWDNPELRSVREVIGEVLSSE